MSDDNKREGIRNQTLVDMTVEYLEGQMEANTPLERIFRDMEAKLRGRFIREGVLSILDSGDSLGSEVVPVGVPEYRPNAEEFLVFRKKGEEFKQIRARDLELPTGGGHLILFKEDGVYQKRKVIVETIVYVPQGVFKEKEPEGNPGTDAGHADSRIDTVDAILNDIYRHNRLRRLKQLPAGPQKDFRFYDYTTVVWREGRRIDAAAEAEARKRVSRILGPVDSSAFLELSGALDFELSIHSIAESLGITSVVMAYDSIADDGMKEDVDYLVGDALQDIAARSLSDSVDRLVIVHNYGADSCVVHVDRLGVEQVAGVMGGDTDDDICRSMYSDHVMYASFPEGAKGFVLNQLLEVSGEESIALSAADEMQLNDLVAMVSENFYPGADHAMLLAEQRMKLKTGGFVYFVGSSADSGIARYAVKHPELF
ncbi:hypothetical protein KY362_03740 [Candidatus Woesearchaeota archaeon]|nr:hypothetical protein [Candidatus Woesearchaeota archaeon]